MARLRNLSAVLLIVWLILPLVPLAIWSFTKAWRYPNLLPNDLSLDAWRYVLTDQSGVLSSLTLTSGIALIVTALSVLIGVPAGRALGLYQFRGKALIEIMILAPIIVPGIAVVLGLQTIFIGLGLNNTVTGVALVHLIPTLPYMILVMASVFTAYDPQAEDQARSLGASPAQVFRHITLPAVLPGIVVGAMFTFLVSWGQYILTLTVGGGRVQTLPLLLFQFAASGRNDITGAIAMIYILPGALILVLIARYLTGRSAAVTGLGR